MPIAALSAGLSAASGAIQSSAAGSAAKAAQQGAAQAKSTDQSVLNQANQQISPYVQQGTAANTALGGLLGINSNAAQSQQAFQNYLGSTNYNFLLNQGEQAQGFLNAPNLSSGATGKALINYGQGMAGNALSGYENILQNQAGMGLTGATALGQLGNQNAQLQQQATLYGSSANANAALQQGNAQAGILGSLGNILGQGTGQSSFANAFGGSGGTNNGNGVTISQPSTIATLFGY